MTPFISQWGDSFTQSLSGVWDGVAAFVPSLVVALIIFAIGWVLAALIEKLVEHVIQALKIDAALRSAGLEEVVKRAGHNLNSGAFLGALVKWFVIIVFLIASFNVLGLNDVTMFLMQVVNYLPHVIIAVLVLMVAVVVANAMQKVVVASARAANLHSGELLGRITKWAIWIFAIIAAIDKLVLVPGLIQAVVTPLFAGIALALGLAFGLGGKETAQKIIEKTSHSLLE
jgi:hypothetical protein